MFKRLMLALVLSLALAAPAAAENTGVYGGLKFIGSSSFDVEFMKPLRPESGPQSGRPW